MSIIYNRELFLRVVSAVIFVPLIILPLLSNYYILVFIYISFVAIILNELDSMKRVNLKNMPIYLYSALAIYTFFVLIFLIITGIAKTYFVIEIIFTIWIFDTFSFFGGKVIGGRKLMPKISKGKTYSGLISGTILTIILTQMYQLIFGQLYSFKSLLITVAVIIFAFMGDMIVSIIKRASSVKDAGIIMPGHGGLLDRLDSFLGVFFIYSFTFIYI